MSSVLYDSLQSRGHPLSANCGRPDQLCFVESVVTVTNTQQCISKCVNEVLSENTPVDNPPYKPPVEILYQTMLLFQCETNDDPILVNMYTQYQEALGNRKCKYAR